MRLFPHELLLAIDLFLLLVLFCLAGPPQEWGPFTKVFVAILVASIIQGLLGIRKDKTR